jgi:hypothetical protein
MKKGRNKENNYNIFKKYKLILSQTHKKRISIVNYAIFNHITRGASKKSQVNLECNRYKKQKSSKPRKNTTELF